MNARQFFDVWSESVKRVASCRAGFGMPSMEPDFIRKTIGERHGPKVAAEAVTYFERLRKDTTEYSAKGRPG